MSQQPARCPRTTYELGLTWLAGGGPRTSLTPATSVLHHSRRRRLDPPDEARDLVVKEKPPPRAPAATSQRRAPTTELRGCLRAREASATACSGLLLAPSAAIGHYLLFGLAVAR